MELEDRLESLQVRNVNRETWNEFKTGVVRETGSMRGVLGEEFGTALGLYIERGDEDRSGGGIESEVEYVRERTVFEIGASSGITLPKEWVDRTGIKKGDKVLIGITRDGKLLIVAGDTAGMCEQ